MTAFLVISAVGVTLIMGLALALPCRACELRRQRMSEAYARWRADRPKG